MLQNNIIDFQQSLLEQELVWNNIENSFLVEKVNVILMEEEDKKTSFGQKIKQTAAKIGEWFRDMIDKLKGHFTKIFESINSKVKKIKSKSSTITDDNVIEVDFVDLKVIDKEITKIENGQENSTDIPKKKVKFKGLKSLLDAILNAISTLFNKAKGLFSKTNSECNKGVSEAKKAESTGDQGALGKANETKKRVTIFTKGLSFLFKVMTFIIELTYVFHIMKKR